MVSDRVGSTSGPLLCNKTQSYLGKTLPWKGSVTTEFLSEALSLGRWGEFGESLSLHWLLFKCLQFKMTDMPKDGVFCCPSSLKQEKVKKSYLLRFFINNFHMFYREWPPDETEMDGDLPPLGFLHKCRSFRFKDISSVLPSPLTRSGEARSPWPGRGHGRADVASPAAPPSTGNLPLGTPFPFCQKITSTGQVVTRSY